MPKYGNSAPGPQKWNFSNFFIFVERSPDFASNEPSTTPDIMFNFKSSYARKRDFGLLCPNMEIRPQAPKNGIFENFFIFVAWKCLQISLLTSPQPPPDIKFKSSYARKRDYAQIGSLGLNFHIWAKWNFSKKLIFERVSRFRF